MKNIIYPTQNNLSVLKEIVKYLPSAIKKQLPKEIAVIAISSQESLKLNRRYRHKRKPANVLSFLYGKEYGEIVLCSAIIKKDAKKQGNTEVFQMTWMVVHGMLHLAGLHHEKSNVIAQRTMRIENTVLDIFFNTSKEIRD